MWLLFITLCAFGLVNSHTRFLRAKHSNLFGAATSIWLEDYAALKQNNALATIPTFKDPRAQGKSLFFHFILCCT
jgi:hypothetical protein